MKNRSIARGALLAMLAFATIVGTGGCTSGAPGQSPTSSGPAPSISSPLASSPSLSPSPASSPAATSPEQAAYQKAMQEWPQVLEAARKEGEAIIYSVYEPSAAKLWEDEFNKLDPKIRIKLVNMTGAVATERIKGEQSTRQYISNGYLGASPSTRPMVEQGLTQMVDLPVLHEPGIRWIVSPLLDAPRETLTFGFNRHQLLVNANLVPPDQQPRRWRDLADTKWKDKLIVWDPRVASQSYVLLGTLYNDPSFGPDVVRRIVENLRIAPTNPDAARTVAKAEMPLALVNYASYLPVKDAPVRLINPEDGAVVGVGQAVVTKNAPQVNTMRIFVNWLLSKEGQKFVNQVGTGTLRPDAEATIKEVQVVGEKFLANVPHSWDFESKGMAEAAKSFRRWVDDLGK